MKNLDGLRSDGNPKDIASEFRAAYFYSWSIKLGRPVGRNTLVRLDGGMSGGRNFKPVWPKLAEKLQDRNIDISSYLEDIVNRYDFDFMRPQLAVKDEYIEEFKKRLDSDNSVLLEWDAEDLVLKREIQLCVKLGDEVHMALARVLCDNSLPVSPLVKYVFGCLNGREDLVRSLSPHAWMQYLRNKTPYDKWCSRRVPLKWRNHE